MGSDERRALWLTLLSPLVTLELIVAGHNDLLMVGMLAAGIAYALDGRPMLGVAICALAATVKVPALAGAAFIAVAWGREELGRGAQVRFMAAAALLALAVLGVVTLVAGVGVDWLSTSLFSTPAKVRLAITPATGLGYTVASLLSDVGIAVSHRGLEGVFGVVAFGLTAVTGAVLLYARAGGAAGAVAGRVSGDRRRGRPGRVAVVLPLGPGAALRAAGAAALAWAWRSPSRSRCSSSSPTGSWRSRCSRPRRWWSSTRSIGAAVWQLGPPPAPSAPESGSGPREQPLGAGRNLVVEGPPGATHVRRGAGATRSRGAGAGGRP